MRGAVSTIYAHPGSPVILSIVFGLGFVVWDVAEGFEAVGGWSQNAAQVLATLLVAVVVEDRFLDRKALRQSGRAQLAAIGLAIWVLWAFILSVDFASRKVTPEQFFAVVVDGAIIAAASLVVFSLTGSLADSPASAQECPKQDSSLGHAPKKAPPGRGAGGRPTSGAGEDPSP